MHLFHLVSDAFSAWRHGKKAAWKCGLPISFMHIHSNNNSRYDEVWLIVLSAGFTRFICEGHFSASEKQVHICVGIYSIGKIVVGQRN